MRGVSLGVDNKIRPYAKRGTIVQPTVAVGKWVLQWQENETNIADGTSYEAYIASLTPAGGAQYNPNGWVQTKTSGGSTTYARYHAATGRWGVRAQSKSRTATYLLDMINAYTSGVRHVSIRTCAYRYGYGFSHSSIRFMNSAGKYVVLLFVREDDTGGGFYQLLTYDVNGVNVTNIRTNFMLPNNTEGPEKEYILEVDENGVLNLFIDNVLIYSETFIGGNVQKVEKYIGGENLSNSTFGNKISAGWRNERIYLFQ